jgi:hypothetical protein
MTTNESAIVNSDHRLATSMSRLHYYYYYYYYYYHHHYPTATTTLTIRSQVTIMLSPLLFSRLK